MPSPRADEEFVEQHWRLALWVARRRAAQAGWRGDPDEVESDAVLGLWNAARTWDPDKSGSPAWVRTHVDRSITDGLRYRYGDVRYEGKASITASLLYLDKQVQNRPPATLGEVTPDPRDLYAESIDRVDVARALVSLSPRHRYVVVARYRDGLTWRAIGEHLGVTEGRAHQLGTEARARLTRTLVPQEDSPLLPSRREGAIRRLRRRSRGPSGQPAGCAPQSAGRDPRPTRRGSTGRGDAFAGTALMSPARPPDPRRHAPRQPAPAVFARDH